MANDERFSISIDIQAPAERVFEVMSDIDRWHEWTPGVTSITRINGDMFGPGSRAVVKQPKFPPALWTVTALEPGRSFTWESRGPAMRVVGHHLAEPTATGARATLSLRYEGFVARLLARLTRGITNRYLAMEANGLKARAENPFFKHAG